MEVTRERNPNWDAWFLGSQLAKSLFNLNALYMTIFDVHIKLV